MRKPEITDEDIIAAGLRLEARGVDVNKTALRDEARGGNPDRLYAVWIAYKDHCAQLDRKLSGLAPEAEEALRAAIDTISAGVRKAVGAAHASAQVTANRRAQDLEHASAQRLATAEDQIAAAGRRVESLESQVQSAAEEASNLRERLHVAEQDKVEARRFRATIEEQLRDTNDDIRMHEVELRHRDNLIAQVTNERDQFRDDCRRAQEQLGECSQASASLALQLEHLRASLNECKTERAQLQGELKTVLAQLADAREDAALARGEINALKQQSQRDVAPPQT